MEIASSIVNRNRRPSADQQRATRRRNSEGLLNRVGSAVRQALSQSTGELPVRGGLREFGNRRQTNGSAISSIGSFLGGQTGSGKLGKLGQLLPAPLSQRELRARYSQTQGQQFSRLNTQEQDRFLRLAETTQVFGSTQQLDQLLRSGRLTARDRQGATVLAHLDRLSRQELQPGVDRNQAIRDLAQNLADPQSFNQDGQGTCTVTAIGREHARTDPADFARVNADLLSRQARTVGQDCTLIPSANLDLTQPDPRSRTQVERVYQDTMMEQGNGPDLTYNSQSDKHEGGIVGQIARGLFGPAGGDLSGNGGLSSGGSARVIAAMLGRRVENRVHLDGPTGLHRVFTRAEFEGRLSEFSSRGERMQVHLRWDGGGHMVNVVRIEGGYVYLDNPHGYGEQGQSGPTRELQGQGGGSRMREDDFYAALVEYHAKADRQAA